MDSLNPQTECFNFQTFWKDTKTADVEVDKDIVRIKRYDLHPAKQIFYNDEMTRYELGRVLQSRCYDKSRPDMDEILKYMGLDEYDVYKMCRFTHGRMTQDNIWFRYEGEDLTWEDMKHPCR